MQTICLPSGQSIPVLGLGTWKMGLATAQRSNEIVALGHGIELGMMLIDTAQMYGEGGAEIVIASVIAT